MENQELTPLQKEQLVLITRMWNDLNLLILSMGFKTILMPHHFDFQKNEKNEEKPCS